jgi:hypothetical protein
MKRSSVSLLIYDQEDKDLREVNMAEGMGFEPTVACATHAFQACSFDRSDTPLNKEGAIITE